MRGGRARGLPTAQPPKESAGGALGGRPKDASPWETHPVPVGTWGCGKPCRARDASRAHSPGGPPASGQRSAGPESGTLPPFTLFSPWVLRFQTTLRHVPFLGVGFTAASLHGGTGRERGAQRPCSRVHPSGSGGIGPLGFPLKLLPGESRGQRLRAEARGTRAREEMRASGGVCVPGSLGRHFREPGVQMRGTNSRARRAG